MIDIHTHIIPGIDDGASTLKQSIAMAREYQKCGFNALIATPHVKEGQYNYTKERIFQETEKLNVEFALAGVDLDVYTGAEYFLDIRILKDCENNNIITLGKSGFVLIEFPSYHLPKYAKTIVSFLLKNGFIPIIAHPERCRHIQEKGYEEIKWFFEKGCKIQVDVQSLIGNNGRRTMKAGWSLFKAGMAEIVSLDAHTPAPFEEYLGQLESMMSGPKKAPLRRFLNIDHVFIQNNNMQLRK